MVTKLAPPSLRLLQKSRDTRAHTICIYIHGARYARLPLMGIVSFVFLYNTIEISLHIKVKQWYVLISRKQFRGVGCLLDQRKTVGQVAYLKKNNRYIFYLVTKGSSSGKPTLSTLQRCLSELRQLCSKLQVTRLAMPRIGCGLDRLDWDKVKHLLNTEFYNTNIEITVYYLKEVCILHFFQ